MRKMNSWETIIIIQTTRMLRPLFKRQRWSTPNQLCQKLKRQVKVSSKSQSMLPRPSKSFRFTPKSTSSSPKPDLRCWYPKSKTTWWRHLNLATHLHSNKKYLSNFKISAWCANSLKIPIQSLQRLVLSANCGKNKQITLLLSRNQKPRDKQKRFR